MKTLKLEIEIEIVEKFKNPDIVARVYYPHEGNKIQIVKGLNSISFIRDCFTHELGHLIDWYLSNGKQSKYRSIREYIANYIARKI